MPLPLIAAASFGTIVATFASFLIGSLIIRVVSAFGIALVSYVGYSAITNKASQFLNDLTFNTGGTDVTAVLQATGILSAASMYLSTYTALFAIKAAMGFFKRLTFGNSA